jgi:hypothetical protein
MQPSWDEQLERLVARWHARPVADPRGARPIALPTNPFFDEPLLGDDDLVFRYDQAGWQWMARGDRSVRRARALVTAG